MDKPLISIITPSHNYGNMIENTILSVKNQSYNNIEHIIIDGDSTDNTINVLKKYEDSYNMHWISEPDNGMYDAIETGFKMANGDIYAWLNADDMYHPWTASIVAEVFVKNNVRWVTGVPAWWDTDGRLYRTANIQPQYKREWIKRGWYHGRGLGYIQQESTFWTADLWIECGGFPPKIKLAGDHYLWKNFAENADLHTIPTILAGYRTHDEHWYDDKKSYYNEIKDDISLIPRLLGGIYTHKIYSLICMLLYDDIIVNGKN